MKRLTSDNTDYIFYDLNLFFAKDNEIWIRGGGPEPDYQDCTLVNWIGRVADKHNLEIYARDAVNLGDEMYDCLQYGIDTIEGVVALLHAAAVQATTMRSRLKEIEDILGDDYDLNRLKELVEADREGKCVLLPCKVGDKLYKISENGVKEVVVQSIVFMLSHTVNHLTVHVANERGAMTEIETKDFGKTVFLTLEEAEAALKKMNEGK